MYDAVADRLQFEMQQLRDRVTTLEAKLAQAGKLPATEPTPPDTGEVSEPWYKQQERALADIKAFCEEHQAEHQADLEAIALDAPSLDTELHIMEGFGMTAGPKRRL